jgi:hypothetical protein
MLKNILFCFEKILDRDSIKRNIKGKTKKKRQKRTEIVQKKSLNRKGTKKSKQNMEKSHFKDHDVKSRSKPPVFVKNWVIKSSFV